MSKNPFVRLLRLSAIVSAMVASFALAGEAEFSPLFPDDGVPMGWHVTHWSDVAKPAPEGAEWRVEKGVLHGSTPRGTWLVSDKEFGDFVLEFEFKLSERGNSGFGFRFPQQGDPAFDGLEVQMVDRRYHGDAEPGPDELTGSLYKAIAPAKQAYKPTEWNAYRISAIGSRIEVVLNGETIQKIDLTKETNALERGKPLAERPRRGRLGFQELSRGGGHVKIRGARIKILPSASP